MWTVQVVAHSCDGAALMSGHVNGIQQKLRQDHISAVYIHCMAHTLHLVLVDVCKINHTAVNPQCIQYPEGARC